MIALLILASSIASAAEPYPAPMTHTGRGLSLSSLSYVVSFPTGKTADFLDGAVSYRGIGLEWDSRVALTDLYWGVSLRWLYFRHVVDNGSFTQGNTTATGRLYSSVDSFPIALHVKYPLAADDKDVLPYVGLGAGTIYGMRQLSIGALEKDQFGWQFMVTPEVGTLIRLNPVSPTRAFLSVRYDQGFGNDAIDTISNVSIAIGFGSAL